MRLENEHGIPCIVLSDAERLADFDIFLSGLRINNGLNRYTEQLLLDSTQAGRLQENEKAYLILIPDFFRDSPDDRYNVGIDDQTGLDSRIEVNYSWSDRLPAFLAKQGNIESVNQRWISGWYKNTRDAQASTLELYINGKLIECIECIEPRSDVAKELGEEFLLTGFEYKWSEELTVRRLELRDSNTQQCVLMTPLVLNARKDSVEQLERVMRFQRHEFGYEHHFFSSDTLKKLFSALRSEPAASFQTTLDRHDNIKGREAGTSVLIPVYNSAKELKDGIKSLLASGDQSPHEILLVNDSSPDESIHPYLAELQIHHPIVHVIRSEINRGFVQTVNKALAARRYHDVIVLNSDTIVPQGMIDRLAAVHDANPSYGVLTPLSNNATIFSFPRTLVNNPYIDQESLASIDRLLHSEASEIVFDVPTAHGYCMFISGEVLDTVGTLDAEEWGVGYAEENDYCQRVKMAGWGIGAYYGMYVGHVGSTSFGEDTREELVHNNLIRLNELYPEYDSLIQHYVHNDKQSRAFRNKLQLHFFKQESEREKRAIILHLSHDLGGGTEEYIRRCANDLKHEDVTILKLWNEGSSKLIISDLSNIIWCEYHQNDVEIAQLWEDLEVLDLLEIVLNSSFNFSDKVLNKLLLSGIPYSALIHDYSWICPKINMIDARGSFCGMPEASVCQTCIEVSGTPDVLTQDWKSNGEDITQWIRKNELLLQNARTIICPSNDTAARIKTKFPSLDLVVRYHSDAFPVPVVAQSHHKTTIYDGLHKQKIAVFGRIGQQKGMAVLKNLIWLLSSRHPGVQICFFGELCEYSWLEGYTNVECVGEYEQDTLSAMIEQHEPTMALFLSVWPETYCYALTDAIKNGVFPVVFDIGAFKERIEMHNFGATIPFTAESESIYESIVGVTNVGSSALIDVSNIKSGVIYESFLKDNMGIVVEESLRVVNG